MAMRVIARRSPSVWLVTDEFANPPKHVQVLDLDIGRLYPPHPREAVLATGGWTMMKKRDAPDAVEMLVGIEVMPSQEDALNGFSMIPATTA